MAQRGFDTLDRLARDEGCVHVSMRMQQTIRLCIRLRQARLWAQSRTAFGPTSQYDRTGEWLATIAKALVHRRTVRVYSFSYTVCIRLAPSLQVDSTLSDTQQYSTLSVLQQFCLVSMTPSLLIADCFIYCISINKYFCIQLQGAYRLLFNYFY